MKRTQKKPLSGVVWLAALGLFGVVVWAAPLPGLAMITGAISYLCLSGALRSRLPPERQSPALPFISAEVIAEGYDRTRKGWGQTYIRVVCLYCGLLALAATVFIIVRLIRTAL